MAILIEMVKIVIHWVRLRFNMVEAFNKNETFVKENPIIRITMKGQKLFNLVVKSKRKTG